MTAKSKVEALPNSLVALAVDELFQRVFSTVPADDVDARMKGVPQLDALLAGDEAALDKRFTQGDSLELGRALLASYADDPALSVLVEEACDRAIEQNKDKMVIGTLLTVGLVANLTYLIMATSVTVTKRADGQLSWRVEKRSSPPEFMSGILNKLISLGAAK